MGTLHEPSRDRVLGPLTAPVGRTLAGVLPAGALALAGVLAAAGAFVALLGDQRVPAGVLILAAGLLDAAGAARAATGFGRVVDGVADRYADTLILAGMAAWAHQHESLLGPLGVGFTALIGAVAVSYMTARVQASAGHDTAARLFAWTGRDVRLLIAAAGALTGQLYWSLVLLSVVTHLPVVWALARLRGLLRNT